MRKVIFGVVIMLGFHACTNELNEIDAVVGQHLDANSLVSNGGDMTSSIPEGSFLVEYFSVNGDATPVSSRIENQIKHNFNGIIKNGLKGSDLGARWRGDFHFEPGEYRFNVKSDKSIKVLIDDQLFFSDMDNAARKSNDRRKKLNGKHRIEVQYNVDETTINEATDNTSTDGSTATENTDSATQNEPIESTTTVESEKVVTESPDTTTDNLTIDNILTINASGTQGNGKYPHFIVLVDGVEVGDAWITSTSYKPYYFSVPKDPANVSEVQVVFDNNGTDRVLKVESIELDRKLYEAATSNVTYQRTNGVIVEYNGRMAWNGRLTFNLPEIDFITSAVEETAEDGTTVQVDWEIVEEPVVTETSTDASTPDTFTTKFFEGFEDGLNFKPPWYKYSNGKGVMEVVSNPVVSGRNALRMYLERKLYSSSSTARAQIEHMPASSAAVKRFPAHFSDRGVKFALYVPADFQADPLNEILFQYHGKADAHDTYTKNPTFYIGARGNKFTSILRTIPTDPSHESAKVTKTFTLADIRPGHWHYFVVDTHWDYRTEGNGFHKVYMKVDQEPTKSDIILDYVGPTGYNDVKTSYAAIDIYKWDWKTQSKVDQSKAAGVTHREYYFDDIEMVDGLYFK